MIFLGITQNWVMTISMDGSYLYRRFSGKLLIAIAFDANNRILPLAYTLV